METVGEAVGWNGWGNFQCYQLRPIHLFTKNHHSSQRPGLNTFQKQKMIERSQSETAISTISKFQIFNFDKSELATLKISKK